MQAAQDSFQDARKVGIGRFFKKTTSLAASSHEMVEALNPLIAIIKDGGAPFGGVAIGTVCFLFAVRRTHILANALSNVQALTDNPIDIGRSHSGQHGRTDCIDVSRYPRQAAGA